LVRQLISNRELVDWSGDEVDMHLAKQMGLSLEFSTQHRKQLVLEKRVQELEHDKGSLQSDFEAAQGSVALMRGMVEKSRREYLAQVQETIKTEILTGQVVTTLDCEMAELKSKVLRLENETSSLHQTNSELAGKLEASEEKTASKEKELEEARCQLEEASSSIASLTTAKETAEAERASFMSVGAEALADGFELALEQVQCVLPDLDLSQFSIHHEVEDGKLIPPPS